MGYSIKIPRGTASEVSDEQIRRVVESMKEELRGPRGRDGQSAEVAQAVGVTVDGEYVFAYSTINPTAAPQPSSITLSAVLHGGLEKYKWRYYDTTTRKWTDLIGRLMFFWYSSNK